MIDGIVHIALLLLFPPLLLGVISKTKAWFAGRTGARVLQPYYDIIKLLRKGLVVSETTTWVFRAGPVVALTATAAAGLLVPFGNFSAPISFAGDFILFAYLFGLGRFFTTSAALDTGSAFAGMGSSREVTFAALSEPALFLAYLALAKASGSLSLDGMTRGFEGDFSVWSAMPLVLLVIGLFIVLLAESCRIPVDDPTTHLELTMIHEAMALDHSGPLFGLISYAAAMKLFVLETLLIRIAVPLRTGSPWTDFFLFIAELVALATGIGVLESITARLRMRRVPYLLVSALLLCGSAFALLVR